MNSFSFREFKPTILFLVKFTSIYLVANLLYGAYITAYHPKPDPVTCWVSAQTATALSLCGWPTTTYDYTQRPTSSLVYKGEGVIAVFEGCNGINTMIIFIAFLVAFGPFGKHMIWFIPAGIVIIHLMNLFRIGMLFIVSKYVPDAMYFTHKYLFTAFLYTVIFVLWLWWVRTFAKKNE